MKEKKQRVVLSLSLEQAKELRLILEDPTLKENSITTKLLRRIEKTIDKHENSKKQLTEEEKKEAERIDSEIDEQDAKAETEEN